MSKNREEEKNRLWNEVMNRDRKMTKEEVELVLETTKEQAKEGTNAILKSADAALSQLNAILQKQKKDLEEMSAEIQKKPEQKLSVDVDALEKQIQKDYGTAKEEVFVPAQVDSKEVFADVLQQLDEAIVGQDDAIQQMTDAFRRPFVMGSEAGKAKNVILVMGPEGSGRHAAISNIAATLAAKKVIPSEEVYTIDLSRYNSGSQEQVFLQDLYQALQGKGSIICFEKFESSFPSFLRMISSLVTSGKVVLNKRYVLSQGILVENQTGLVKNSVDSLTAEGKYLVFVTHGKISGVQDAFGADFMYHVLDTIKFSALNKEEMVEVVDKQLTLLAKKCEEQMKLQMSYSDDVKEWMVAHYDKNHGMDAIVSLCNDFYVSLSQIMIRDNSIAKVDLVVEDDVPVAKYGEMQAVLTRSRNSQQEIDEVNAELAKIVGLRNVKEYMTSLQAHVKVQQRRKEQGMKVAEVSKHMIFTGNPGTGKTTIARLLARYMKAIGVLSQGQLVEVTRADLVAQYVGQTAPLTMSVIRSAMGGVLFIDEAYALHRGKDDSFGLEAIDTLVKAMEDYRDDLIVILAGYKKEMSVFLEANSGLKSRFPNVIEFPDYTGEELYKIASLQAEGKGYHLSADCQEPLINYFTLIQKTDAVSAGNGRLARNVVEDAILKQASRLAEEPDAPIDILELKDFVLDK